MSRSSSSGSRFLSDAPVYLIADLHLHGDRPAATTLLLEFLSGPVREARALYILGDLFEAWIGDDAPLAPGEDVARALLAASDSGVELFFLVGNRDFLLGRDYCKRSGMNLLSEPHRIVQDGFPVLLMHGDVLCIDDEDYQRFRRKVREPAWQARMLSRPVWLRRGLARVARTISRHRNRNKPASIMDVNPNAVAETMKIEAIPNLIHGHTHRPAIHHLEVAGRPAIRAVLGDWHDDRGSTIRLEGGRLELMRIGRHSSGRIMLEREQSCGLRPSAAQACES
jgi:UDP-2,3-diacylglucosamine hydrolase